MSRTKGKIDIQKKRGGTGEIVNLTSTGSNWFIAEELLKEDAQHIVSLWNLNETYDLSLVGEVVEALGHAIDVLDLEDDNEPYMEAVMIKLRNSLSNIKREKV